jgi:hypothetical protein
MPKSQDPGRSRSASLEASIRCQWLSCLKDAFEGRQHQRPAFDRARIRLRLRFEVIVYDPKLSRRPGLRQLVGHAGSD